MLLNELKNFKTNLEYHHKLNPALWDNNVLKSEVKDKLKDIADKFITELELKDKDIKDIFLTGSNTNYNWTEISDIDLHILVKKNKDLDRLDAIKSLWNETHDIKIKGFPVEVYVEDEHTNQSGNAGLYSLKDDKWVREPIYENIKFDYNKIKAKAEKWMKKIDALIKENDSLEKAKILKDKIRDTRHAAIAKGGEFSMENLIFKTLRNNNYIKKLYDYILKKEDEKLSLK